MGVFRAIAGAEAKHGSVPVRIRRVLSTRRVEVEPLDQSAVPYSLDVAKLSPPDQTIENAFYDRFGDPTEITPEAEVEAQRVAAIIEPLARLDRIPEDLVTVARRELGRARSWVLHLVEELRVNDYNPLAMLPKRRGRKKGGRVLDQRVERVISDGIEEIYLKNRAMKVEQFVAQVWKICDGKKLKRPTSAAVRARISDLDPGLLLERKHVPKKIRARAEARPGRFPGAESPLDVVQIDHTPVDVIVVDRAHRKPIGRPWATLAIDVATRCIWASYISLDDPSGASVGIVIADGIASKQPYLDRLGIKGSWPLSGVPGVIHLDNAKIHKAKGVVWGCRKHGIRLQYRKPGKPHHGGHVERLIGTFMGKVHLLSGTTYSNVQERGEEKSEAQATVCIDELETWWVEQILIYHATLHRGISGETPMARLRRLLGPDADEAIGPRTGRYIDPEIRLRDFLPYENRMLRPDGITWDRHIYWDDVLRPLLAGNERKIMVRRDPRNLSRTFMLRPDQNGYYVIRSRNFDTPITLWEHHFARKRLRDKGIRWPTGEEIVREVLEWRREDQKVAPKSVSARRRQERRRKTAEHIARTTEPTRSGRREDQKVAPKSVSARPGPERRRKTAEHITRTTEPTSSVETAPVTPAREQRKVRVLPGSGWGA